MRENNFQGELPAFFDKLRTEDRDKYYGKSAVNILYMISYNNSIKQIVLTMISLPTCISRIGL